MEVKINLDNYLLRQKELFDAFIKNGKETDLLPLLKKYSEEDNKEFNISTAQEYIKSYVSSKNIKESELDEYKKVTTINPEEFYKMGKKAIISLIYSNNDELELYIIADEYAKKDGKINSYPIEYVKKAIDYYIKNTKDEKIVKIYERIKKITKNKNGKSFDLSLITELITINNINEAITFIKNISISNKKLTTLINTYIALYPGNESEINYLKTLKKKLNDSNNNKLIPKNDITKQQIIKLKKLIEDFLTSDEESIFDIHNTHHMSSIEFTSAVEEAENINDKILKSLIDKYNIKMSSINEKQNEIIKNIGNGILNGVNYGNGFREFNVFDYLLRYNGIKYEVLIYGLDRVFKKDEIEVIIEKLKTIDLSNSYNSIEDLSKSIGIFSKNGRNMKKTEKELIIKYISDNNLPLNNKVFFATCERYFDGDLKIN